MPQETVMTMEPEVSETRGRPRFNLEATVEAQFAGQPAIVRNLSANGIGLRHAAQVRVNSTVFVRIDAPENEIATQIRCRVVWSRLSSAGGGGRGRNLYDSGLLILDDAPAVAGLLGRLIRAYGVKDQDSLAAKRRVLEARAKERANGMVQAPAVVSALPRITPDQVLLIREAQELLATNPDAVAKWHDRAKQSLVRNGLVAPDAKSSPHRRDVLVIWEYLGGRLDLDVVSMIAGMKAEA